MELLKIVNSVFSNSAKLDADGNQLTPLRIIEEVAKDNKLEVSNVVDILNDPEFISLYSKLTKAKSTILIHGIGFNRLENILANGNPREAIQAYKLMGEISGELKNSRQVQVDMNFDKLLENRENKRKLDNSNILNLFQIGE